MTILDAILATKRNEVDKAARVRPLDQVRLGAILQPPPRDFFGAVTAPDGPQLIAEVKRRSPSAGEIVPDFDPVAIARAYEQSGAAAISVLTDRTYFGGELVFLTAVRRAVSLPALRKDFIIDAYQVYEARAAGADAVLLIAEALTATGLADLLPIVRELAMTPLVEVHSADALQKLLHKFGPPGSTSYLLGINNRDLDVQKTDRETMVRLGRMLSGGAPWVAESGLATRADVLQAKEAGACAVLIGESILKSGDFAGKTRHLLGRE